MVLPEGLEVSNLFYFWLSSTLERYMGDGVTVEELEIFRNNVFGISLSATGLSEVCVGIIERGGWVGWYTLIFFVSGKYEFCRGHWRLRCHTVVPTSTW